MLELSFTAADVAYTRFAFSPLWEVVASVLVLKGELGTTSTPGGSPGRANASAGSTGGHPGHHLAATGRRLARRRRRGVLGPGTRPVLAEDPDAAGSRRPDRATSALFTDLNPAVRWQDARLFVDHPHVTARRGLRGKGLLLVPSAFTWPRVFSITVPGWQPLPATGVSPSCGRTGRRPRRQHSSACSARARHAC